MASFSEAQILDLGIMVLVFTNSFLISSLSAFPAQVKLMKRIAEMSDIKPILRKLPRIKKYLLNSDNIR